MKIKTVHSPVTTYHLERQMRIEILHDKGAGGILFRPDFKRLFHEADVCSSELNISACRVATVENAAQTWRTVRTVIAIMRSECQFV